MLAIDLNGFFLKYALWVPPTDVLITGRLVLWFAVSLPGVREYYDFIRRTSPYDRAANPDDARFAKLGVFAWLAIAMTCLEALVAAKHGRGLYGAPAPRAVVAAWAAAAAAVGGGLAAWELRLRARRRREQRLRAASAKRQ
jgi:phosphatidylserine synthase 2